MKNHSKKANKRKRQTNKKNISTKIVDFIKSDIFSYPFMALCIICLMSVFVMMVLNDIQGECDTHEYDECLVRGYHMGECEECEKCVYMTEMNCSNIDNNVWRCENGRFYHFT